MKQAKTQARPKKIEAIHKYKVIDTNSKLVLAGTRFHFIGAGGIGMSGLAQLLMKHKAIVTGSDQTPSDIVDRLCRFGADIKIGHSPENLSPDTDVVVLSAAIKEDNPELKLARKRGCKVYKYARMLGELVNRYDGIAISGTHGKSTTCGWLAYLLKKAGIDTNFIIGAVISQLGTSSGVADSPFFVAEACEYDRSFLNLKPRIACILNIEQDHLDYYRDEQEIVEAFGDFVRGTRPDGVLIANGQDSNVARIIMDSRSLDYASLDYARDRQDKFRRNDKIVRFETFGLSENCNFNAKNLQASNGLYSFDVYHNGRLLGPTRLSIPGKHNVMNALAVAAMAVNAGLDSKLVLELLPLFTGMDRRVMLKGQHKQITVLDDYAHHPTEIRASLQAMRDKFKPKRLWCIFQPHQYSRTRFLLDDFAESFKLADITIVPEIYFVRDSENEKKAVNAQKLVSRIRANGTEAIFIDGFAGICDYLKKNVKSGDLVVTMGAGDIWKVADEYIQWLRENS